MNNHKYIIRFNYGTTIGWQFRHYAPDLNRFFADNLFGSKDDALTAAIKYRDATLKALGLSHHVTLGAKLPRTAQRANVSGIIGVQLYFDTRYDDVGSWQGVGMIDGKSWRRTFAIQTHGELGAYFAACESRYENHGELAVIGKLDDLPAIPKVPYALY